MSRILVTGGTGSLGTKLVPTLLAENHIVTVLSRDPHKQLVLAAKIKNPNLKFILGDIRDRESVMEACSGQDIVIHAAALKIVSMAKDNMREYITINTIGSLNVAEACRFNGIDKALLISTDKVPASSTAYGFTKGLAESLWLAKNSPYNITQFSALRYGNVVESNGSVWHVWQRRLEHDLPLVVRMPEPTRFFLSLNQAVGMVVNALRYMQGGEIFVPGNVKAFSLWDLARTMQPENLWQKEPLLPSEKQHEILVAETEYVEPATDIPSFQDIDLWRIWPKRTPQIYETPPLFASAEANRLSGLEVIAKLQNN